MNDIDTPLASASMRDGAMALNDISWEVAFACIYLHSCNVVPTAAEHAQNTVVGVRLLA